ncbi:glycosyltransferase family 39 protein [bacterium]|nr:glycosyltransferase family 39 protein [bacterium]
MDRAEYLWLAAILAAGFAVRLYFLLAYENIFSWEAEDYSKINLVLAWIEQGKPYPDPNFGPLHTWLIYLITLPFEDRVLPVRLVSLVCGTGALAAFFGMARFTVGRAAALIATALFAFYPVHVRASATSLAEAPYTLLFFGGLWAFARYWRSDGPRTAWVAASGLMLGAAGMLRFEAWLFYPGLCLWALAADKSAKGFAKACVYGAILAAFPLWHMYYCWKTAGNPFSFGATSAASFELYLPSMPLSYRATAWLQAFWLAMSPYLAVTALLGLVWAAFARRGGFLLTLFVFPFALMNYRTLQGQIDPALLRYSVVLAALLIPTGAGAIEETGKILGRWLKRPAIISGVVTAGLCVAMTTWALAQAEENRLPEDLKHLASFLAHDTADGERIILDKRFHPYLVVESRKDPASLRTLMYAGGPVPAQDYERLARKFFPLSDRHAPEVPPGRDIKLFDRTAYEQMMDEFNPTLLVLDFESGGNIQAFPIEPDEESAVIDGRTFTRVFREGEYAVFKIAPAAEGDE